MYKVVIQHGAVGSPKENWIPWLEEKVESSGHTVITPTLPTPEGQNLENWLKKFREQAGEVDEKTILIGHSIAPAFFLSVLEKSDKPVRATFLVSGFLKTIGDEFFEHINKTFYTKSFDWEKIRKSAGTVFFYGSDSDPYVAFPLMEEFADKLGVKVVNIPNGGHLNASAGFTSFPRLFEDLEKILNT